METNDVVLKHVPIRFRPAVVISAGAILQFTNGLLYTFGNLLPYLASYLRWKVEPELNSGTLIWIQSLMAGMPFAMLVGGYMEKRIGAKKSAFAGFGLYTGALAISSYSIQHSFILLLVTMGWLSSFGSGIGYNAVLICCQRWLPNRVGLVSGLITAGYALSAVLLAPLETHFINPLNYETDVQGYFTQVDLLERVPKLFLLLASLFGVLQLTALLFLGEPVDYQHTEVVQRALFAPPSYPILDTNASETRESEAEESDPESEEDNEGPLAGEELAPLCPAPQAAAQRSNPYLVPTHREVFTSSTFVLLFLTLLLNGVWTQITSGLFKAYGQTFIPDDFFLATVNSLAAATNCVSRVLWGIAADKTCYQASMAVATGVGAFLMLSLGTLSLHGERFVFLLWICLMFSCIGATFALLPYAVHRCFGSKNFGIAYGCLQLSLSFSGLVTALASQFLLPLIGFPMMFTIAGITMTISFLITTVIHLTKYGHGACS